MSPEGSAHAARVERVQAAARAAAGAPLRLAKPTSNLFRDRHRDARQCLDLRELDHVLEANAGSVDAEGLVTYEALADATLGRQAMPAVVPQLKTITLGGAAAGVGIEATSFRHGLVHHTLREIEVLLPGGDVVVCTPGNEHRDLFLGFPNSYGTLGYALRLEAATIPVKPYVRVGHAAHRSARAFFEALARACADPRSDFVDGVAFGGDDLVLNVGAFVESAPFTSDYGFERIYYRSLREKDEDYLATRDYLWRWDTDWFWCSRNVGAQNPLLRRLLGRRRLNSRTYQRLMRLNTRLGLTRRLDRWRGLHRESVIQDVDIPIEHAADFLAFLVREIGILPVWICPVAVPSGSPDFTFYPMRRDTLYVNFGFWDVVRTREAQERGHFNRLVERRVIASGGIKSLYSDSYFTREEFDTAYHLEAYAALKRKYDPRGRAPGLYDKCVLRA
ncbi:MAG: FAD-binding protein [Betaproteobacteria bacterium]